MVNLKKVVKIGSNKENPNKEDQQKYEEKVKNMRAACANFKKKFKEYLDIPQMWQSLLKCCFKEQMAKNRLVSRTSRILHDMSNKLSKFKDYFDPNKVAEYSKAFYFKAKKANSKDYIKRSAIDDASVVDFFTNYIPNLLKEVNHPLDEKTGTFTVRTQDDFCKSEKCKTKIKKIIMGENIKTVRRHAFFGYTKLQNIDLKNVKIVGMYAFSDCTALKSVNLGNVTTIGESAFYDCTALQSIDFKNVETVGKHAFFKSESLESINLNNVTTVEDSAFSNCTKLQNIDLGRVTNIGDFAFNDCAALQSIDFKNVETVGRYAFFNCTKLQNIDLGRVTNIEDFAFNGCTALQSIDFKNVETVGMAAFSNCTSLKTVTLPTNKEKAAKIKKIILNQTGKNAGDGENGTIQFINDPEPAKQKK